MKLISVALGILAIGSVAAGAARAQDSEHVGDPATGRHLARIICSACHVVGADQSVSPILRPPAPAFIAIANRPDVSAASLSNFINHTHPVTPKLGQMPNPQLLPDQVADVVSYILTLKKQHQAHSDAANPPPGK